jgi:hypothetical protein
VRKAKSKTCVLGGEIYITACFRSGCAASNCAPKSKMIDAKYTQNRKAITVASEPKTRS